MAVTMFMFDLDLPGLTDARARAAAEEAADRNAWPLRYAAERTERRWFGIEKFYPAVIDMPTESGVPALAPDAERDAETIHLHPVAIPRLVAAVEILADQFPDGFVFRATWSGSPIQRDVTLSPAELTDLVQHSGLNEFTRYVVTPDPGTAGG